MEVKDKILAVVCACVFLSVIEVRNGFFMFDSWSLFVVRYLGAEGSPRET